MPKLCYTYDGKRSVIISHQVIKPSVTIAAPIIVIPAKLMHNTTLTNVAKKLLSSPLDASRDKRYIWTLLTMNNINPSKIV